MRTTKLSRAAAMAGVALIISATAVLAGTEVDSGDRAIVGTAASSATAAQLECGGDAVTIQLTVTADDGNVPSAQAAQAGVTVPTALTVGSAGTLTASGSQTQFFPVKNFSTGGAETLTFNIELSAASNAPSGAGNGAITFGAGGMVTLGNQVTLVAGFTNPSIYWNVTCATYEIVGFYQPVNNHLVNGAKAGSTIPLKFDILLDGVEQSDTSLVKSMIQKYTCDSGDTVDMLTTDELSSGSTSLRWDADGEQFIFNWKTPKTAGCYRVTVTVEGGDSISAEFQLR